MSKLVKLCNNCAPCFNRSDFGFNPFYLELPWFSEHNVLREYFQAVYPLLRKTLLPFENNHFSWRYSCRTCMRGLEVEKFCRRRCLCCHRFIGTIWKYFVRIPRLLELPS